MYAMSCHILKAIIISKYNLKCANCVLEYFCSVLNFMFHDYCVTIQVTYEHIIRENKIDFTLPLLYV